MTRMLASIRDIAEAHQVLAVNVDIIDLKDPHSGILGSLDQQMIISILDVIQNQITTSATIGDYQPDDPKIEQAVLHMVDAGVDIVKVGLFARLPSRKFTDLIYKLSHHIKIVVVLFAEHYLGLESYQPLLQSKLYGMMLDTCNKNSGGLRSILADDILDMFVTDMNAHGFGSGLAGGLMFDDIPALLQFNPEYLGFRGALCTQSKRIGQIDMHRLQTIRTAIPTEQARR